jgi:hypothetical protein
MERRNLLAGLMVLVISSFLLAGTAFAHKTPTGGKTGKTEDPSTCLVRSLPSFIAQGEFGRASSVADIIEVECESVYAEHFVKVSSQELFNSCADKLSWFSIGQGGGLVKGASISKVPLDDDGNATIVVWGGPSCASITESLISAHLEEAPYETFTTAFSVMAPKPTTPSVKATPETQVENDTFSSVATIIQVEFPTVDAEQEVHINAEQLFSRCLVAPHLVWIGPDEGETIGAEKGLLEAAETVKVKLDNDGNAFVVAIGAFSCASGPSEIEASLEVAPYTTYKADFTVKPPEETAH